MLSIDPSSPFTRGALLGDRIRLSDHFLDPGVFIRSMASRGALGGLSEAALQVALVMDAAGKDDVLIETVGVGQAEIDIVDHADTIVLALMPGSGDSIQALKAGVMEIPDVIVVNKADHPMTDTMVREVRGVLALSHDPEGWQVPILQTEAASGEGVEELAEQDRRAPRVHRGRGHAGGAAGPQPAQRGARHRHLADAPQARGDRGRGPRDRRACSTASCGASSIRRPPPPSCWRGRAPMDESPVGFAVDDIAGAKVGNVHGVYVDAESGEPAWLIVSVGRRRAKLVAVPVADCAGGRGPGLGRPRAPRCSTRRPGIDPTRPLLREHELAICAHLRDRRAGRPRRRGGRPRRAGASSPGRPAP